MHDKHIDLTLTADAKGKSLIVIESSIGNGFEAPPAKIRAIAAALYAAADQADARDAKKQASSSKRIKIDLTDTHVLNQYIEKHRPVVPQAVPSPSIASASNPNRLLDTLLEKLQLKNDAALSRVLDVASPVLSKIRHCRLPVGPSLLLRMHDISGLSIAELKALLD